MAWWMWKSLNARHLQEKTSGTWRGTRWCGISSLKICQNKTGRFWNCFVTSKVTMAFCQNFKSLTILFARSLPFLHMSEHSWCFSLHIREKKWHRERISFHAKQSWAVSTGQTSQNTKKVLPSKTTFPTVEKRTENKEKETITIKKKISSYIATCVR